jgi:hypothetical protein
MRPTYHPMSYSFFLFLIFGYLVFWFFGVLLNDTETWGLLVNMFGKGKGKITASENAAECISMYGYLVTFKDIFDCLLCNYTFSLALGGTVCGGGIHIRV